MNYFTVYILYSSRFKKSYVGYTSNLPERFKSHNYLSKSGWTIHYRPWEVIYVRVFNNKLSALKHEKWLKSGIGRKWLRSMFENEFKLLGFIPELTEHIDECLLKKSQD